MRKTIILLLDDLDPNGETQADDTVTFALDGTHYEIDLTTANADKLRAILEPYAKAGRLLSRNTATSSRPMTIDAGHGATYNRHQGGVDPKAARAWAIQHDLMDPGTRGRTPKDIKAAYSAFNKFGDRGPLNELLAERQAEKAASKPVEEHNQSRSAVETNESQQPEPTKQFAAAQTAAEAEAKKHYRPIKRSAKAANDTTWARRTASGCERTERVENMTLVERIDALTSRNVVILGKLAGIIPLDKGGKVSHLQTSVNRLENLEFIEENGSSPHGWAITDFGRYAHEVRSLGD